MAVKKKKSGLRMPAPVEMRLDEINFAPYNPRIFPDDRMRALKASIEKHGMVLTLVVQKRGRVLIGGHQRVRAIRELCAEKNWPLPMTAWVVLLDIDDAAAKQLNVALNGIDGEFDPYLLGDLFKPILGSMTQSDILATGFERESIDELIKLTLPPDTIADQLEGSVGDMTGFARSITLTVEFGTVEERDRIKALLAAEAKRRNVKAGRVVADAVKALSASKAKPRARAKG